MLTLKLKRYQKLEFNLKMLLEAFNDLTLNNTAQHYANNLPVIEVNTDTILRQHAYDKASTLSNFKEMQSVGIDISIAVPSCETTRFSLDSIVNLVNVYMDSLYNNELKYISYGQRAKSFIINEAGKKALEQAVITLDGKQEKIYKQVMNLHNDLMDIDKKLVLNVFNGDKIVHPFSSDMLIDNLVQYIMESTGK
jgi:hypothetical protein